MKTALFDYQDKAAGRVLDLLRKDGFHIIDADMGLGKSLMALAIREVFVDVKCEAINTVIVAPKTLLSNWAREIQTHSSNPPPYVIWDSVACKRDYFKRSMSDLIKTGGVLLVNVEAFGRANEYLEGWLGPFLKKPTVMILDESSKVKDQGAHRTKYISKVFSGCKFKLALTGTLNANSPLDVYGQFLVVNPDFWRSRGFRTWHLFRSFFGVLQEVYGQGGRTFKKVVGYRKLEQLKSLISPYVTTIRKEDVLDLPEKVFSRITVDLNPEEEKAYNDLKRMMMTTLTSGELIAVDQKIGLYQKFRQLCGGWIGPDIPVTAKPSKLEALQDLCEDSGEQMIIFAVFTHEIMQIADMLGAEAEIYDGSVPVSDRQRIVDDFNAKRVKYLVVQPLAGAYGLNLQANCNTVVYYSRPNSPEVMAQSQDRIHRIGQTKTCFYIDLVAQGRIDEKVIEALDAHQDLSKLFSAINAQNIDEFV